MSHTVPRVDTSTTRRGNPQATGVVLAVGLALAACSPQPIWIAVADSSNQHVMLFDETLAHVDTRAFEYRDGPLGHSQHVHVSNGGAALLLGFARHDGNDVILRVRIADGQLVDQWPIAKQPVPEPWMYLHASRTLVGFYRPPSSADSTPASLSLVTPDRDWAEDRLEICHGRPRGLASFNRGERLFVACDGEPSTIVEIDTARRRVVRTSSEGLEACRPGDAALSRTQGILFVLCEESGKLLFKDRVTLRTIDAVDVGAGARALLVRPDRPEALLLFPDRNELIVVDLAVQSVRARMATDFPPRDATLSGSGRVAYVTTSRQNGGEGAILMVDLAPAEITATASLPAGASALALWPGPESPKLDWR